MRKLTLFETSVIGFFVGVIAATYMAFLYGTGGFVGKLIAWISLAPIIHMLDQAGQDSLVIPFLFFVAVYTLYGLIAGLILRKGNTKIMYTGAALVVLALLGIFLEQKSGIVAQAKKQDIFPPVLPLVAAVNKAIDKPAEKYFGTEATGDLDGDGKDDIAFLITRTDDERGKLYYLSTALRTTEGRAGTNLIFLGDRVEPVQLSIEDKVIVIEYQDHANTTATSTQKMYAHVVQGVLSQMKTPPVISTVATSSPIDTAVSTSTPESVATSTPQ